MIKNIHIRHLFNCRNVRQMSLAREVLAGENFERQLDVWNLKKDEELILISYPKGNYNRYKSVFNYLDKKGFVFVARPVEE